MSDLEFDPDGIKLLHKITGNKVDLTEGNDHKNGQRYSVNHRFLNYMMIGYFRTGKGQDVLEMKTDGPNHGGCNKEGGVADENIQDCCWTEVNVSLIDRKNKETETGNVRKYKAGENYISSEHPHPVNWNAPENIPSAKIIQENLRERWVGRAVCAWQEGEFRHLQGWIDMDPFDDAGKPKNNWVLGIDEVDTGQFTTPELAKRKIPIDHVKEGKVRGLECEIRMNNAINHDCEIKFAKVYEIIPPA